MKKEGFTLIEIILVVLILSLAVGMVAPRIGGGAARIKEQDFVMALVQSILRARETAMSSGKTERFFIDPGERAFGVDQKMYGRIPGNVDIYAQGLENLENEKFVITFFPDGTSPAIKLDVTFDKSRQYIISIDPVLGTVSWAKGSAS